MSYQCLFSECDQWHPKRSDGGVLVCGHCSGSGADDCESCRGTGILPCSGRTGKTFDCQSPAVGWSVDDDEPMCAAHLTVRVKTKVRNLLPGDTLGSGFTVQHVCNAGVGITPAQSEVTGAYPGKAPLVKVWGSDTTVRVTRARS